MRASRPWILGTVAFLATSAIAVVGCSSSGESSGDDDGASAAAFSEKQKLELTDDQRREMVSKKSTCPFVGTALAMKKIFAFGSLDNPFANIGEGPGNVTAVGNTGGGDLGEGFRIVARANHHQSPNGEEAPNGMFSLAFPNSRGAHAAHSSILMGDPRSPSTGRLNVENLDRLIKQKGAGGHAETAQNGTLVVRRSELGKFVARNVACDPNAVTASTKPFGLGTLLGSDLVDFNRRAFSVLALKLEQRANSDEVTKLLEDMVTIATRNNLVGSVGELGLLMTFLGPSKETVVMQDGEPALAVSEITAIFAGEKKMGKYNPLTRHFPANWETTPKTIPDFLKHTVHILKAASSSHLLGEFHDNAKHAGEFPVCPRQ